MSNDKQSMTLQEFNKYAKEAMYTKEQLIYLVESLKHYTKEAQCILGNDEREASEFVEIFIDVFLLKNHMQEEMTAWGQGMASDKHKLNKSE